MSKIPLLDVFRAPKSLGGGIRVLNSPLLFEGRVKPATVTTRPAGTVAFPVPPSGAFTGEFGFTPNEGRPPNGERAGGATKRLKQRKSPSRRQKHRKRRHRHHQRCRTSPFTKIEIRIGKITKVWNIQILKSYFAKKSILRGQCAQCCIGLRPYYKLEDLQDRNSFGV